MACPTDEGMQVIGLPDFWTTVRSARTRFLGLDYDGTLAPFHVDRMRARPFPRIRETLKALQETKATTLAVISGRPVAEVLNLLGNLRITLIGSHGYELLRPDGTLMVRDPGPEQREGLRKARDLAVALKLEGKLEHKVASIAFHTRGMSDEMASRLEKQIFAAWSGITAEHGLECRQFNGGVEVRATGWHKGDALSSLLANQPEGALAVYVGDDETDEDAFKVIQAHGIGIRVGTPVHPTAARGFLTDCQAVPDFLAIWLSLTST
jgi:trehalose 6-phosphate phosphatase